MHPPHVLANQRRAALEIIDDLARELTPGRPFLAILRTQLSRNKGYGSQDRRRYREIVFAWLRFRSWFDALRAIDGEKALDLLVLLAGDSPEMMPLQMAIGQPGGFSRRDWPDVRGKLESYFPDVDFDLRALLPAWFEKHCPALFEEKEIVLQLTRPPFWLRAQRGTSADLVHELARCSISAEASPQIPWAVRVNQRVELEEDEIVTSGRAEIQDIGSQALLTMVAPEPGGHWLDFCAGAGGKSLQLARLVGNTGRVTAYDLRRDALMELKRRMIRAMIPNIKIEPVLPEPGPVQFDGVLVDAPCSASGTWRRHPFLRHQIEPEVIERRALEQLELLCDAAGFVKRRGRLVYATCSLSKMENEDVVAAFLKNNSDFQLEAPALLPGMTATQPPWVTLMPSFLDSDGYFLACMRRE